MNYSVLYLLILIFPLSLTGQEMDTVSIHQLEMEYYRNLGTKNTAFYDSLHHFQEVKGHGRTGGKTVKRVFGYQPYWGGSNYLNYQWDLLTDLCYFSYEVDPTSGLPLTIHDWQTSPSIDSAFANDVDVHLCVTLFSGHGTFFTNPEAQQTLVDQIIFLLQEREANGVNMDVEALPSLYKEEFMDFIILLSGQLNDSLPDAELSIAAPAVNWSNKFDVPLLNEYIDFFMVMAYDYFWGGSALAGPVSPLYPMVEYYTYCFSRSISYYQSEGVPTEKLVMGVPYYAYQWKTEGQFAPSATIGQGTALTYRNVMDNITGHYSKENKHLEPNSFGPYYSFETSGWYQCFMDDVYSMEKKFDIINRRDLGGIGIWALGYDNGYSDFWDLIETKFGGAGHIVNADTIFDSGGPAFDYFDDEDYTYTLETNPGTKIYLSFTYLDTEENYDSLWIFDGPDVQSPLMGIFTGDEIPELIIGASNSLTLQFYSDAATTDPGWRAVYDTIPVSGFKKHEIQTLSKTWPNPANQFVYLDLSGIDPGKSNKISIFDIQGKQIYTAIAVEGNSQLKINLSSWFPGSYVALLQDGDEEIFRWKILVK